MIKFPELITYSDHFENAQRDILHHWMSQDQVYDTLQAYSITPEFFGRYFGRRVIEYTFGTLRGKNELGNCPIIGVMLVYFQKKNFAVDDIFLLCTQLKNVMILYSLNYKVLTQKTMQEIAHLMDQNLKGVIREFIDTRLSPLSPHVLSCPITSDRELPAITVITTSALHYLQEIEIDFEVLDELNEIETEAISSLNLNEIVSEKAYREVIGLFSNYTKVLNQLLEFKEITYALSVLIDILERTGFDTINEEHFAIITIYIKAITSDLSMWRNSVFVSQTAEDIHYLDATLLSSITQLQIMLSENTNTTTCDIEFF